MDKYLHLQIIDDSTQRWFEFIIHRVVGFQLFILENTLTNQSQQWMTWNEVDERLEELWQQKQKQSKEVHSD